jgi:hypothetical protein
MVMEMHADMNLGKKSVETLVRSQQTARDARRDVGKGSSWNGGNLGEMQVCSINWKQMQVCKVKGDKICSSKLGMVCRKSCRRDARRDVGKRKFVEWWKLGRIASFQYKLERNASLQRK